MKKITLLFFMLCMSTVSVQAQYSCANAVQLTNGYTATNITTPGAGSGSPAAWVSQSVDCSGGTSSTLGASTCWNQVFDTAGDDYMFKYTTGAVAGESIVFEVLVRQNYMGIMAFTDCNGTSLTGCLSGAYAAGVSGGSATMTISANNLAANQTIYIGVGVWSTPNNLNFDVTNFTVTVPPLGVNEVEQNKIRVYPNPVADLLNIYGLQETSDVAIYNLIGQEVLRVNKFDGQSNINVSSLSPGTYLVKVSADAKTETYKIIKQ